MPKKQEGPSLRRGSAFDGFKIGGKLGEGGNSVVYRASRADVGEVALKVLKSSNPDAEPFKRFYREVTRQQNELQDVVGLLPILCAQLEPDDETKHPWMAMPVAKRARTALGKAPTLREVVTAIASVAATLARLHATGHSHRDIKPDNLLSWQFAWYVADLGLIKTAGDDSLTTRVGGLGPRNYIAPEMLLDPPDDARPSDVYSLAKTLWVLASGQHLPVGGHQPSRWEGVRLSRYVNNDKSDLLDYLIDRCTENEVHLRPSMQHVVEELDAWLYPSALKRPHSDSTAILRAFVRHVEPTLDVRDPIATVYEGMSNLSQTILQPGLHALAPLYKELTGYSFGIATSHDLRDIEHGLSVPGDTVNFGYTTSSRRAYILSEKLDQAPFELQLLSGFHVMPYRDGTIGLVVGHLLRTNRELETLWLETQRFSVPSALAVTNATNMMNSLAEVLPEVVASYIERVKSLRVTG